MEARQHVADGLRAFVKARCEVDASAVVDAYLASPILQTSDHAQLILDPVTFATNLVHYIGGVAAGRRHLIVNASSTVTMTTRGHSGPGWLDIAGHPVSVFDASAKRLRRSSVCAATWPARFALCGSNGTSGREDVFLRRLQGLVGSEPYPSVADAFIIANGRLWRDLDWSERTELVYTDDRLTADVTARHLDDARSPLRRMLIEAEARHAFERHMVRVRTGAVRYALPMSTAWFWGVRDGRIRALACNGRDLREVESGRRHVAFSASALAEGLRGGLLFPSLALGFLVLGVIPHARVLGGSSQMIYLPAIAAAWRAYCREAGEGGTLDPVDGGGWIAGVIEDHRHPLAVLSDGPDGAQLPTLARRWAAIPLRESIGSLRICEYLRSWARELA